MNYEEKQIKQERLKKKEPKKQDVKFEEEEEVDTEEKRPTVLKSEILSAISEMKEGKAVGVDDILAEMLKIWERRP